MSIFSDFADSFTGESAGKELAAGKARADAALKSGLDAGTGYYDQAYETLDPYAKGGSKAFDAWLDSMGLSGADRAKAVSDAYFDNPVNQRINELTTKANTRQYTGIGMGNSGAATQSLTNALLKNWQAYQEALRAGGGQGQQAATGQAGVRTGQGDMQWGYGQQQAGNEITYANARAKNSGTFAQNALNGLATAAKFIPK
jgi:hypothetical protein